MKKINSIFKTIVVVAIVLVMAQGCVPAGGNTPTSGTFNVGIDDHNIWNGPNFTDKITKIVVVDGDSLLFCIRRIGSWAREQNFAIYTKSSTGNIYEFLSTKNNSPYVEYYPFTPLNQGVTIPSAIDTTLYQWNADVQFNPYYYDNIGNTEYDNHFGITGASVSGFTALEYCHNNGNGTFDCRWLKAGTNYFVFRRLKPTGYQYYWVKLINSVGLASVYGTGMYFRIENGKYQMNSIITGQ